MKVTISVPGRLHGFDLAREIQSQGHLQQLISSYPFFIAKKFEIERSHYHSLIFWELFRRGLQKIKPAYQSVWNEQFLISDGYDRAAAKQLCGGSDIFVGWSGSSLHSLRAAKKLGMCTVLERGSAHIEVQYRILTEEYARHGLKFTETHPKIIEKEVQEYQEADFISIPSAFVRRSFLERGIPESKLIQIPYGVSLKEFAPKPRSSSKKPFRLIYVGILSIRKGVHYLLRAFAELDLKDSELWLIGDSSAEIKPLLQKLPSNVRVFGKVSQEKLREFYLNASVFCICSLEDGFGMVVSQAMSCGLPILCTENTGGADIVRDGMDGFILPIRDVEKLKEKIIFFHENHEAVNQMGKNAAEQVQKSYDWTHYGKKMVSAYARILSIKKETGAKA